MPRALMIIAQEVFRDEEYAEPKAVLERAGVNVTTASRAAGPAHGKLGMEAIADVGIVDVDPEEYDAIIFVGGTGAATYFDDPVAHRIARSADERGIVVLDTRPDDRLVFASGAKKQD